MTNELTNPIAILDGEIARIRENIQASVGQPAVDI